MNIDKYTKIILTIIALNTTLMVGDSLLSKFIPDAWAQETISVYVEGGRLDSVYVEGGRLDYETDITGGATLFVKCINC